MEPIAITGIGCRFPGANGPAAFWALLCAGIDAITEVPAERWDITRFYHPDPATPGTMTTRWGGFLADIDRFDPLFFKIAQREAAYIDPQQRLLLELAWEALEDGGYVVSQLAGSKTGIFVGVGGFDYAKRQMTIPEAIDTYTNTGSALSIAANRISYVFDFRGPSLALDTACSSSLVAVHLACQSLRAGECDLALAGGVNLILGPETTIGFSKLGAMAPDGRCKAFDASADGYVRSEGAGIVVLKPLSAALAAGDPIYALIRGSAVNQDGRTNGLTAPNRRSQEELLREAYAQAGVAPNSVAYVEAHGTGTLLGDPIEAQALGAVLGAGRPADQPCTLGSVKTNIGHLEFAAGIAGLIKVALMLKHRMMPPNLHFQSPNPHIPFAELKLRVATSLEPLPGGDTPLLAGVSSFGFGGTNAHAVLEAAPSLEPRSAPAQRPELLPLSAHTPAALHALVQRYADWLVTPQSAELNLYDFCYSASVRRSHHNHRLGFVAASLDELRSRLAAWLEGHADATSTPAQRRGGRAPKVVFVFPGQGSQWIGMGRELLHHEPVFRATLEACELAFRPYVDWSLLEQLQLPAVESRLEEIGVVQPTLFAISVGLAALWRSWGIAPDAVVGHSMGEVAAAYVAGALSLEDAARVICCRSQLLRRIGGQGAMMVVELPLAEAEALCADYAGLISVAAINDPRSVVLAGDAASLAQLGERLQQQQIFARHIRVDVASHSPQVEPLLPELREALAGLAPRRATVPFYSTVTTTLLSGTECDADYWVRNLRQPVCFAAAIAMLIERGHELFLELSPHPVLLPAVEHGLRHSGREGVALASLRRGEPERAQLLEALAQLYTCRREPDWPQLYSQGGNLISLPAYPWQRERCWIDLPASQAQSSLRNGTVHPLLGQHLVPANQADMHYWDSDLGPPTLPYLSEHQVLGRIVLPAAAYLEMALVAARQRFGTQALLLEEVTFSQMLAFGPDELRRVQMALTPQGPSSEQFELFSRAITSPDDAQPWVRHVTGRLGQAGPNAVQAPDLVTLQARCRQQLDSATYYRDLAAQGLEYGPAFQGLTQITYADGIALAQLIATPPVRMAGEAYLLHPALLDACFQLLGAAMPRSEVAGRTYLPVAVQRLCFYHAPPADQPLWAVANLAATPLTGDIVVFDQSGRVLFEIAGLRVQALETAAASRPSDELADWFYQVSWEVAARREAASREAGRWLIFSASAPQGQRLANELRANGAICTIVTPGFSYRQFASDHYQLDPANPEHYRRLLADALDAAGPPCRGVVHMWGLALPSTSDPDLVTLTAAHELSCHSALYLVQALAHAALRDQPRLWLVTRGAQMVAAADQASAIYHAPLWGLGSVIVHEYPQLHCTRVDLDPLRAEDEMEVLCSELWADDPENQVALRATGRYVARLLRFWPATDALASRRLLAGEQPFSLAIPRPGVLDDLLLRASPRPAPGPGEVEIAVEAAGLNFVDVLTALGIAPGQDTTYAQVGGEAAGIVTALGPGVTELSVGDAVVACTAGCFSTHIIAPVERVVRKPDHLSFAEAAGLPMIFMTVYYGLHRLAHLSAGERVLIHSAASGTGLAAVQWAQRVGAEIFATAGTPEKRARLQAMGVKHVFSSRTLDFAKAILEATGGKGVDVVLNSLSGAAIPKSLEVLGLYGRYVELSKRDIYQNSRLALAPFRRSLSYFAVDLAGMAFVRPQFFGSLLREVMQLFATGELHPLPTDVVPITRIADAFHSMAQARHQGKIVVSLAEHKQASIVPPTPHDPLIRAQRSYLITGGLGGIGLQLARWLVEKGVRYLALVGRSAPSAEAQATLAELAASGAKVQVYTADVSVPSAVAGLLDQIATDLPPLCGIFHAAAVLDDGVLLQQNADRFTRVMAPKVAGAWNLHLQTRHLPLDYFVLFSSAAAVLGSPGQSNYAAANAFLDALAHTRRAAGLPALSINWGPWAEIGLAAAQIQRGERLANQGVGSIAPTQGFAALGRLLQQESAQLSVLPLNLRQWQQSFLQAARLPLFTHLLAEAEQRPITTARGSLRTLLEAAAPSERLGLLEAHICEQTSRVLRVPSEQIGRHTALGSIGLDSLMALELRNRLEDSLGMDFPVTLIWNYQSVADLAYHLAGRLELDVAAAAPAADPPAQANTPALELSDEQHDELIALLSEINRLSVDEL